MTDTRLIPSGITLHWILDPGIDHDDMRILAIEMRLRTRTTPLDRRTTVTVRGPGITYGGATIRGCFAKSLTLGALPEQLRDQIITDAAEGLRDNHERLT